MSALVAVRAALDTAGVPRVYHFGSVPTSPTYPYVVISSAPGAPQVRTLDGSGDQQGRFAIQHFGRTVEAVEALAALSFVTFDGRPLALPGGPVAWQEVASSLYRDPDTGGVLTITHTYRY